MIGRQTPPATAAHPFGRDERLAYIHSIPLKQSRTFPNVTPCKHRGGVEIIDLFVLKTASDFLQNFGKTHGS